MYLHKQFCEDKNKTQNEQTMNKSIEIYPNVHKTQKSII